MKRECIAIVKTVKKCTVDTEKCIGCKKCMNDLGCPALVPDGDKVAIGNTCNGCNVCGQICPVGAIGEVVL